VHPYWLIYFACVAGALMLVASFGALLRRAERRERRAVGAALHRRHGGLFQQGWRFDVEPESVRLVVRPPRAIVALASLGLGIAWWTLARPLLAPMLGRLPLPAGSRAALAEPVPPRAGLWGLVALAAGSYGLLVARRRVAVLLEARGELRWELNGAFGTTAGSCSPETFQGFDVDPVDGRVSIVHGDPDAPAEVELWAAEEGATEQLVADLQAVADAIAELAARRPA
jgi:hypothetical protein